MVWLRWWDEVGSVSQLNWEITFCVYYLYVYSSNHIDNITMDVSKILIAIIVIIIFNIL